MAVPAENVAVTTKAATAVRITVTPPPHRNCLGDPDNIEVSIYSPQGLTVVVLDITGEISAAVVNAWPFSGRSLVSKLSSPLMDDAEPTKAADAADSGSEQTAAIPDSSETARAELAWSAATDEQETEPFSEKGSRSLWLGPVMALLGAAIAVGSVLLFYLHRAPAPKAPAPTPPSASARPAPPAAPPAPPATSAAPLAPPPPSPAPASPTPAPVQAAPTYTPPPVREQDPKADQRFLALASQIPGITITDPVAVANSGRAMCRGLQNGRTPADEAVATANNTGLTPEHAAAVVTAAISVYCPQYLG